MQSQVSQKLATDLARLRHAGLDLYELVEERLLVLVGNADAVLQVVGCAFHQLSPHGT